MIKNSLYDPQLTKYEYKAKIEAYYFLEWNNFNMEKQHIHDQVEIMYLIHGNCIISIEDEDIQMSDGDFVLIDAGVFHALKMAENTKCKMLNIEFGFDKMEKNLASIKVLSENVSSVKELLMSRKKYHLLKASNDMFLYLKNIIQELSMKSEDNEYSIQLLFLNIIIRISKMVQNLKKQTTNLHVYKAASFIQKNFDNELRVSDISDYLKINENYLQRIFKLNTGKTLLQYINDLRLDKAKMLLSNTSIPIIEISNYVGINSRQYFSSLFKKNFKISPAQYRKANSKLNNQFLKSK